MNRTLKFGYSYLGNHTLIKLNAKLNSSDIDYLKTSFPGLCFIHNQKGLTRIEGCLTTSEAYSFNSKLAYCLLEYKISLMQAKQRELLGIYNNVDPDDYIMDYSLTI
jgi:hypothetical protein